MQSPPVLVRIGYARKAGQVYLFVPAFLHSEWPESGVDATERTKNSMRNIAFGLTGQILNIIMSFIARTVLVTTLGDVYAGVSGNFTNILMVFSLADLGVGTAIIYALYKPIAQRNEQKIQALMRLYARAYTIIGLVIVGLGLVTLPFLDFIMKTDIAIPDLELIFMLYVLGTASSYFLAYKGTLITANQKNYIVTNVVYSTSIVSYGIQIAIILLTKNFVLSLAVQIATNILQNVITMCIANRMYPYIRGKSEARLRRVEKREIFSNVRSLMFYRTGQVIINGTDSIVISSMIGVIEAGIYSNYMLLFTTIKNLLQQVFHAITASVGNLNAIESQEHKYEIFKITLFANFWMFGFSTVCFWVLINPFIGDIWLGEQRVLDQTVVLFLVLNFYLLGMRNTCITFRDTMGIFRQGRFVPLIAALVNIGVSIWLAGQMGMIGVFIGTTVSIVLVLLWLEPVILFKYGFERSPAMYFVKYVVYLLVTAGTAWLTNFCCTLLFPGTSIGMFIGRLAICAVLPNLVFFALFFRTHECRALFSRVAGILKRKLKRGGAV